MATHDVDRTILISIGSGQANTRPAIVKQASLAPSTVLAAMSRLIEAGVIAEAEHSVSMGGWHTHRLVTSDDAEAFAPIELEAHHGLIALTDPTRRVGQALSLFIDIAEGPQAALDVVMDGVFHQGEATGVRVGSVALTVPGPVGAERSCVTRPARTPGWDSINVAEAVTEQCSLPVLIENDMRVRAIGKFIYRRRLQGVTPIDTPIHVKADSTIGDAYLVDGVSQVGQGGLTGDTLHIPVEAAAGRSCKCGNVGCLETIVSVNSIRADLATAGLVYENNAQLLVAARDGTPEVVAAARQAGTLPGHCVAHLASFLAPQGVIVGGALSAVDTFTTGVHAALCQSYLPSAMKHLVIESPRSGREVAPWGLSIFTPSKIPRENRS